MTESMPGLTEGRMCHYVAYNQRHLAAIIIGWQGGVDLAVFTNMENVNGNKAIRQIAWENVVKWLVLVRFHVLCRIAGNKNFGVQFHECVAYSEEPVPGTWHWIEKV